MAIVLVWLCIGCSKTETETKIGAMPHKGAAGVPKNMQLTAVYLHEYPVSDTKGNKWDETDGPDVFFIIMKDAQTLVKSEVADNIPYTIFEGAVNDTLPAVWRFTHPLEFKDYATNTNRYYICFYDRDDTGDQLIVPAAETPRPRTARSGPYL